MNPAQSLDFHLSSDGRRKILHDNRVIAVVGLSDNQWKPSYSVAEYMQDAGYRIVPVNPNRMGKLILGEQVYGQLSDIPFSVEIVNVFRPAETTSIVAEQAVAIGAGVLWLQLGIVNQGAASIARAGGLTVVMDRCIATDHERLVGIESVNEGP